MKITQISVFLENKKGRLYEVCSLLGKSSINIRALTIAESKDFGVLKMVVDKPRDAVSILTQHDFVNRITDIVAVEVEDKPGGLASVLRVLSHNNVNIEYMYGFVEKYSDSALLVFKFDETDRALEVLTKNRVKIIGKKEIQGL
jgi:hypothetical protein